MLRQGPPCTPAWDSSGQSSSRQERGSLSRPFRCRRHRAPWQHLRRTLAAHRSVVQTCADLQATGLDESPATRSTDQCDRSGDSPGDVAFRSRARIPRLCAYSACFACCFSQLLWTQKREEDHVADRFGISKQHGQTINPNPLAAGWRHAVGERADVIFIHYMSFFVAAFAFRELLLEAATLLFRIVQLAEGVADLQSADKNLEALDPVRLVLFVLRERRDRDREVIQDRGLPEMLLGDSLKHVRDRFPGRFCWIVRHVRTVFGVESLHQLPYRTGTSEIGHLGSRCATLWPVFDNCLPH